jgi:hypothetical protein
MVFNLFERVLMFRIPIVYGGAEIVIVPHRSFEYLYSFEPSTVEGCIWQRGYDHSAQCPFRCSLYILSDYGAPLRFVEANSSLPSLHSCRRISINVSNLSFLLRC